MDKTLSQGWDRYLFTISAPMFDLCFTFIVCIDRFNYLFLGTTDDKNESKVRKTYVVFSS